MFRPFHDLRFLNLLISTNFFHSFFYSHFHSLLYIFHVVPCASSSSLNDKQSLVCSSGVAFWFVLAFFHQFFFFHHFRSYYYYYWTDRDSRYWRVQLQSVCSVRTHLCFPFVIHATNIFDLIPFDNAIAFAVYFSRKIFFIFIFFFAFCWVGGYSFVGLLSTFYLRDIRFAFGL